MAGTQTGAIPITIFQVVGSANALPQQRRMPEGASKTFHIGVPVVLSSGYIQESGAITTATPAIIGFSSEAAHNLTSAGVAPIGGSGTTYGSVQNQTGAVNVPLGAPMADGNCGVFIANNETIMVGKTDDACTLAATQVGSQMGLTKDSGSGQWFVDSQIASGATGAVVEVLQLVDAVGTVGGRVSFRVILSAQGLGL
jgi:hypothetical protein